MKLKDKHILIFVAEDYEDLELQYPKYRFIEEGATVTVAGQKKGETYKGKKGYPCKADISFDEVDVDQFDALVLPGGYAPDHLRKIPKVIEITQKFHKDKKLIAFICHAGSIPVSANIIRGIRCTSYISIKDDLLNAGAHWVDQPVVMDHHFISSRNPDDLPVFCPAIIDYLQLVFV